MSKIITFHSEDTWVYILVTRIFSEVFAHASRKLLVPLLQRLLLPMLRSEKKLKSTTGFSDIRIAGK